jgi:glycosyltransferase involved in cell wall biosynthesis
LCIANGVEHAHFARTRPEPAEYREIPRPRALYVGSIAAWLDVDLLRKAALALPDLALVIIGPGSERLAALTGLANVHLLGARPYADIPAYMQHAEVGLIPFKRAGMEGFVDDINPLKLYEYMAAGLPVLATRFRQLELLGGPTHLVDGEPAFIAVLGRLAAAPGDGAAERAFAARFDWARQLEPLFDRLRL